jgi:psiF repeat
MFCRVTLVAASLLLPAVAFGQARPTTPTPASPAPALTTVTTAAPLPGAETTTKAKKPPSPKQLAAYERMRRCNAEAREKDLHGDPRKAFMKGCLSTQAAPNT